MKVNAMNAASHNLAASLACFVSLLMLFISAVSVSAAEWQWSVPDDKARAYLWIPPDCPRVRAVVVANHNMIEQGILEHPTMRRTLGELGIAQVWVVPKLDGPFNFNKGAGEHFQRIIDALALESGYSELKFAPVIPLGHSACATFPWNFAAWKPAQTLCVLSVHGDAPQTKLTGYGGANTDWGDRKIDGIPALMVMGEYEWGEDRLAPATSFLAKHPACPITFRGDAGRGHYDFSDDLVSFLAMFVRKSAESRLPTASSTSAPSDAPPDGPVTLKPVDPKTGWRIDRWRKDQPPTAPAAPYEQYTGNPADAFWCFDEETARSIEATYARPRGKKPQLVAFVQDDKPIAGEPANLKFITGADGVTFHVGTQFLDTVSGVGTNPARWAGLPDGTPLGHATGGGPIEISKIVGPVAVLGPDTFALRLDRSVYTPDRRNNDLWLLSSHAGDDQYKSAVQQGTVRVSENRIGTPQTITFPKIDDQPASTKSLKLAATSDAGMPVSYYLREGPAEVNGDTIEFTPVPTRGKFPFKVTVVAWQWGRSVEPKVQTAAPVEMTFFLFKP